jgi:hypothetical protein
VTAALLSIAGLLCVWYAVTARLIGAMLEEFTDDPDT